MARNRKLYQETYYKEHKKEFERRRKKQIIHQKNCEECGKLMKREDYIPNENKDYPESSWKTRKYCSDLCSKKHFQKVRKINYCSICVSKEVKDKIGMEVQYSGKSVNYVLKNLFEIKEEYLEKELENFKEESPYLVKIVCLQSDGEKEKGETFLTQYNEGDNIGEFWQGDERYKIVKIISMTYSPD